MTVREALAAALNADLQRDKGKQGINELLGLGDRLDLIIAHLERAGFVIVPRVPTEAMCDAAENGPLAAYLGNQADYHVSRSTWAAMLAAALAEPRGGD